MPDVGRKNTNSAGKTRNLSESHGNHPNGMGMCGICTEHPMGNMRRVWKPDDVLDMLKCVVWLSWLGNWVKLEQKLGKWMTDWGIRVMGMGVGIDDEDDRGHGDVEMGQREV